MTSKQDLDNIQPFELDSCLEHYDEAKFNESQQYSRNSENKQNQQNYRETVQFEEIVVQTFSAIYGSIATNPQKYTEQSQQQTNLQESRNFNKKQLDAQKLLLPVNSNIQTSQTRKLPTNKKSGNLIIPSNGINLQNLCLSRHKTQKLNKRQKQNMGSLSPHTQRHVRIKSQQTIKYFPQYQLQESRLQQRNPQSSFQNIQRLFTQLSRQFQYIGDFSLIRKQLVQLALQKKFTIMQNTNEFVTIKVSSPLDYCQCLLKSCLSFQESNGVYQLKNSLYKRNKAKFILISGNQKHFLKFFRKILIKLWNKKKLKLKAKQLVEFFIEVEKQDNSFKQLKKEYSKFYNEFSGLSTSPKVQLQRQKSPGKSLLNKLKQNIKRLKSPSKGNQNAKSSTQDKSTKLAQFNTKINKKFNQLRQKLISSQNLPQIDNLTLQKQLETYIYFYQFPIWKLFSFQCEQTFKNFIKKKQMILNSYSLKKIFSYLEIQEQYDLFMVQKDRLRSRKNIQERDQNTIKSNRNMIASMKEQSKFDSQLTEPSVPYQECLKQVQKMAQNSLPPTKFMSLLQQFYKKMQIFYTKLYEQKPIVKLSSMDDQLPIVIFILLMSQCNVHSICNNLYGKLKWLQKWIQYQQLSNTSIEGDYKQDGKSTAYGKQGFQTQRKIITTLEAAFIFIQKQWKFEQSNTC